MHSYLADIICDINVFQSVMLCGHGLPGEFEDHGEPHLPRSFSGRRSTSTFF